MSFPRRENVLLKVNPTDSSRPDFASGYTVIAYETGGVVRTSQTSTTINLDDGHGFAIGDKILIRPGTSNIYSGEAISAVSTTPGAGSITFPTFGAAVAVVVGDIIINLGPDPGSPDPAYTASGVTIYSDMDGGTAIANSMVTADASGSYAYFYNTQNIWELIRDGSGTPVGASLSLMGTVLGSSASVVDNAIVRFDGTTGQLIQGYTSGSPTISDTGAVTIPTTLAVTQSATVGTTLGVIGKITGGGELELDGALNHDGTTVGFYGVAPATQPTAYTQTYSTATKTHASPTATALTDSSGGSASQTLAAITGGGAACENATKNAVASIADEVNKLITDLANVKQVVNQILDDLQTQGLLQ